MNSNMETVILGKKVRLSPREKAGLKGFTIGEKIAYRFFDGEYQVVPLLFVKPKGDNPTPRECDITGRRLSGVTGLPTVFILHLGPTYERQRLMDKGVYFIMSEKYAFLPMVVALEKTANRKITSPHGNKCVPPQFTISLGRWQRTPRHRQAHGGGS